MALNYTTSPNGLFIQLGLGVKHYNLQQTDGNDLSTDLAAIADVYQAMTSSGADILFDGFASTVQAWRSQHIGRRTNLVELNTRRMQDSETVLTEIGATTSDIAEVLARLIDDMVSQSETVKENVAAAPTPTAGGSNTGDGEVLVTLLLDGVTSPGIGRNGAYPPHLQYAGLTSQLTQASETMQWLCNDDSTFGECQFQWSGGVPDVADGLDTTPGSGLINSAMVPINSTSGNTLTNGRMTSTTDWEDVVGGPIGSGEIEWLLHNDPFYALRFTQTSGTDYQTIKQDLPDALTQQRAYWLMFRCKASSASPMGGSGTLKVSIGTAPNSEVTANAAIEITDTNFESNFDTVYSTVFIMPNNVTDSLALYAEVDTAIGAAETIDLWDFALAPVEYGGGIGAALVNGADTDFVAGDRFTSAITNTDAGVFQTYFRNAHGVQLISDTSGSETIADTLAT